MGFVALEQVDVLFFQIGQFTGDVDRHRHVPVYQLIEQKAHAPVTETVSMPGIDGITHHLQIALVHVLNVFFLQEGYRRIETQCIFSDRFH